VPTPVLTATIHINPAEPGDCFALSLRFGSWQQRPNSARKETKKGAAVVASAAISRGGHGAGAAIARRGYYGEWGATKRKPRRSNRRLPQCQRSDRARSARKVAGGSKCQVHFGPHCKIFVGLPKSVALHLNLASKE
jgi:hypothetical protein